ncbi:MAG: hypothetical protein QOJ80_81 [Mycobacterium sp.]|nr:hypothetical protein [Mycobacterium sp.]
MIEVLLIEAMVAAAPCHVDARREELPRQSPIVLDHRRVVDGDVGCAPVEVIHRVAALGHHAIDEPLRRRSAHNGVRVSACDTLTGAPSQSTVDVTEPARDPSARGTRVCEADRAGTLVPWHIPS